MVNPFTVRVKGISENLNKCHPQLDWGFIRRQKKRFLKVPLIFILKTIFP